MEMLATYFMHDGGDTAKWRLKRHAKADFWRWVASWAAVLAHPRDIGYDMDGYDLPALDIHNHTVEVESSIAGGLFGDTRVNATTIHAVLRDSAEARVNVVQRIIQNVGHESWLVWCNTDHEQDLIERALPGIASVRGSDTVAHKESRLLGFADGTYRHLVTKPKIGGFGMNWQHCSHMVFCGVSYSFEQMYQAIRRCWRFGQTRPVHVHMVTCNAQESVRAALRVKEEAFHCMAEDMARYCKQEVTR